MLRLPPLLVLRRRHPGVREVFAQVADRAAVEGVAVVRPVQDALGTVQLHADARTGELLDVGTGGGFPGLPLHILIPGLRTTLLDAVRKKVSFLRHLVRVLDLKRVEAVHARVEQLAEQEGHARRYDVIFSRAFSAVPPFVTAVLPMLKPCGRLVALKGRVSAAEMEELRDMAAGGSLGAVMSLDLQRYALPGLKSERTLVVLSRPADASRPA